MELILMVTASALALLLGRAVHRRLGFVTHVESFSMSPTLEPGQRLLVRRQRGRRPLRRGDIVVVDSAEVGRLIIKRVVGLPGERVDVAASGEVRVDGRGLGEPYARHRGGTARTFQVPPGQLLLLGDNRALSSDARVWRDPYVPVSAVLGRAVSYESSSAAAPPDPGSPQRGGAPAGSRSPSAAL